MVTLIQRVRCAECLYETTIAVGYPVTASHGADKCRSRAWELVSEARILTSVGPVEAPVLGSERACPGCQERCDTCDQEALD